MQEWLNHGISNDYCCKERRKSDVRVRRDEWVRDKWIFGESRRREEWIRRSKSNTTWSDCLSSKVSNPSGQALGDLYQCHLPIPCFSIRRDLQRWVTAAEERHNMVEGFVFRICIVVSLSWFAVGFVTSTEAVLEKVYSLPIEAAVLNPLLN